MRIILAGAVGVMIVSLAGCGDPRDQFKTTAVESCITSSRGATGAAAQLDFPRLCNCAIDRYMAGKTNDELRNANPQDPALIAASQQCAMEQLGGAAAPGAAGAPPAGEPAGNEAEEAQPAE